jgi:hypothetical protein
MTSIRPSLALTALFAFPFAAVAEADCNCRGGMPSMAPAPMHPPGYGPLPYASPANPYGPQYAPPPAAPCADGAGGGRCDLGRYPAPAPPGTLGHTYDMCSRPLPEDEHPRSAGLEIRTCDVARIDVEKMEGYLGEDGLWHFTTEKPWIPGRPAIVKVVLERTTTDSLVKDVRTVRLVPGRILSLEF